MVLNTDISQFISTIIVKNSVQISSLVLIFTSGMSIKTFLFVVRTIFLRIRQHCNVNPVSWMPIWIVVSFFWTLVTSSLAVWILSCESSIPFFQILVRCEQTYQEAYCQFNFLQFQLYITSYPGSFGSKLICIRNLAHCELYSYSVTVLDDRIILFKLY